MDIFESLKNLNVSEECFEDIVGLVEEYINETKKANKIKQQEAIFKKLNPNGEYASLDPWFRNRDVKDLPKLTNLRKGQYGYKGGVAHTMQDFRNAEGTDNPDSAPYDDPETGSKAKTYKAQEVRRLLGRDNEFSKPSQEPSKSHQAAQQYLKYKKVLRDAKGK